MRAGVLIGVVLLGSPLWSQDADLIPEAYLAPKYVAPIDAPSDTVIAGRGERGDRLIVSGRALDRGKPVAGVSIYAFHADADGLYTRDGRNSDENARLFATLRTDAEGRYRYETIRPRGYDGLAAHVHHVVTAAGTGRACAISGWGTSRTSSPAARPVCRCRRARQCSYGCPPAARTACGASRTISRCCLSRTESRPGNVP